MRLMFNDITEAASVAFGRCRFLFGKRGSSGKGDARRFVVGSAVKGTIEKQWHVRENIVQPRRMSFARSKTILKSTCHAETSLVAVFFQTCADFSNDHESRHEFHFPSRSSPPRCDIKRQSSKKLKRRCGFRDKH
jgi:hypothetical protein